MSVKLELVLSILARTVCRLSGRRVRDTSRRSWKRERAAGMQETRQAARQPMSRLCDGHFFACKDSSLTLKGASQVPPNRQLKQLSRFSVPLTSCLASERSRTRASSADLRSGSPSFRKFGRLEHASTVGSRYSTRISSLEMVTHVPRVFKAVVRDASTESARKLWHGGGPAEAAESRGTPCCSKLSRRNSLRDHVHAICVDLRKASRALNFC